MSLDMLTEGIRKAAVENPDFPHRVALRVNGLGTILWDGTATPAVVSTVAEADGSAEAVIGLEGETLAQILAGTLDPGDAWMDGLFDVEGSTTAAIALGQLFLVDTDDDSGS